MRKTSAYARKRTHRRADPFTLINTRNTRLRAHEIERIMTPCRLALEAFQTGQASYRQWVVLNTAATVAIAIEDGRVIRGQRQIIDAAYGVLGDIGERAGRTADAWRPVTCYGPELLALQDLVHAHSRQLHELTYGEYTDCTNLAERRVASGGGQVFRMETTVTE